MFAADFHAAFMAAAVAFIDGYSQNFAYQAANLGRGAPIKVGQAEIDIAEGAGRPRFRRWWVLGEIHALQRVQRRQ